jgi:hypothetical protein
MCFLSAQLDWHSLSFIVFATPPTPFGKPLNHMITINNLTKKVCRMKKSYLNEVNEAKTVDMTKEIVSESLSKLKPDTSYTLKQIFGDNWHLFNTKFKREIGRVVRNLAEHKDLPLKCVGKNSSKSLEYIKH